MPSIEKAPFDVKTSLSRSTSKAPAQRERILELLRSRGSQGVTNRELNEIGFRYGARLWELRHQGFDIETIREGEAIFRFVLHAEPSESKCVSLHSTGGTSDWYVRATGKPRPSGQFELDGLPLFAGVHP